MTRPALMVALLSLLSSSASPGLAAEPDYARPGFYLGFGGSVGFNLDLESDLEARFGSVGVSDPVGFELRAGRRIGPRIAVEGEFEWLPDSDVDFRSSGSSVDLEIWALSANLKVYALTSRVQPFLLSGIGGARRTLEIAGQKDADSEFIVRVGGGVDYYVTDHIVFELDTTYVLPRRSLVVFDYVSFAFGLHWRF